MAILQFLLTAGMLVQQIQAAIDSFSLTITSQHPCVDTCLVGDKGDYAVSGNMLAALGCQTPFDNHCYCATATSASSKVTSFISKCATSSCGAGDVDQDVTIMQSIYASYCLQAGYSQATTTATTTTTPIGQATSPGSFATTVTRTIGITGAAQPNGELHSVGGCQCISIPLVMDLLTQYQGTLTVWVDSSGNPIPATNLPDNSSSNDLRLGLGLGLGLGIPLLASVAALIWLFRRRRASLAAGVVQSTNQDRVISQSDFLPAEEPKPDEPDTPAPVVAETEPQRHVSTRMTIPELPPTGITPELPS
jgi:hypothetical protein